MRSLTIIGSTELIDFPKQGITGVPAKTDTGADTSAVWASDISQKRGKLSFKLFGEGSEFYTGEVITLGRASFSTTEVTNSFGHTEERYKVKLTIVVCGRRIRASMTLADRSKTTYPVLLGRRLLARKFLVDVRRREIDLNSDKG